MMPSSLHPTIYPTVTAPMDPLRQTIKGFFFFFSSSSRGTMEWLASTMNSESVYSVDLSDGTVYI